MRRPEGLGLRVLAVSLLGVLVGGVLVFFTATFLVSSMAIERGLQLDDDVRALRVAACLEDPAGFSLHMQGVTAYAYDGADRRSANPEAPAVDPGLWEELGSTSADVVTSVDLPPASGAALVRFGPPGACELLGVRWSSPATNRRRGFGWLIGLMAGLLVLAGMLAIFAAIRPLLRRIEVLARSAEKVGDAEAFVPVRDGADDALGRLAARLEQSHERIVAANDSLASRARALEEHLENVAHDVRTPLAALQLRLEGLLADATETSDAGRLTASIADVVYLTQLTENLRLASRLEHGLPASAHARELDLVPLMRRVLERFATIGGLSGIKVRGSWPDEPILVTGDPAAAEQLVANLAHNAVTHARTEVTLRLDHHDEGFELAVVDDGPGVDPDNLARLSERRFREDRARSRGPRGTGLGLAIVAEVCRRFDWTLAFDQLDPPGLEVVIRGSVDQSHS